MKRKLDEFIGIISELVLSVLFLLIPTILILFVPVMALVKLINLIIDMI